MFLILQTHTISIHGPNELDPYATLEAKCSEQHLNTLYGIPLQTGAQLLLATVTSSWTLLKGASKVLNSTRVTFMSKSAFCGCSSH